MEISIQEFRELLTVLDYEYGGSQIDPNKAFAESDIIVKHERNKVAKLEEIVKLLSCAIIGADDSNGECFGDPGEVCYGFCTSNRCKACMLLKKYEDAYGEIE